MLIPFDKIQPGDILFVRRGLNDYIHVGICTKTDGTYRSTFMAHTLGKAPPYALVETHLAPLQVLTAKDLHYDIVRPLATTNIHLVLELLSAWVDLLIPYDTNKYLKLVSSTSNIDLIGSEGSLDRYPKHIRAALIQNEINHQNSLFEVNKYSIINLAATRNIGPTPPVSVTSTKNVNGIICTSPVIMAFQISSLANQVGTVDNFWVSDTNVDSHELQILLNPEKQSHKDYLAYIKQLKAINNHSKSTITYHSSLRLLKTSLEKLDFSCITKGVRLDQYTCPVSILFFSLLSDKQSFIHIGELIVPDCPSATNFKDEFERGIPELFSRANSKREIYSKQLNLECGYTLYTKTFSSIKSEILRHSLF